MTEYESLKAFGHSPAKAAEIVLDASRGDEYARKWIASAIEARRAETGTGSVHESAAPKADAQEAAA